MHISYTGIVTSLVTWTPDLISLFNNLVLLPAAIDSDERINAKDAHSLLKHITKYTVLYGFSYFFMILFI